MNLISKVCNMCDKDLSIKENFYKNSSAKDGYRNICKDCISLQGEQYYKRNVDRILAHKKEYRKNNKEVVSATVGKYLKKRKLSDPLFKLTCNIRSLVQKSITSSGKKKSSKTVALLGCDFEFFKQHLETQFQPGMTWDNYGSDWTIDHICPCSQAKNEQELLSLQHYSNLTPSFDNFIKSDNATIEAVSNCNLILGRGWE